MVGGIYCFNHLLFKVSIIPSNLCNKQNIPYISFGKLKVGLVGHNSHFICLTSIIPSNLCSRHLTFFVVPIVPNIATFLHNKHLSDVMLIIPSNLCSKQNLGVTSFSKL